MDCSLPGSSIHGICQARVLEQWEGPWVPPPGRCLLFPLDCLSLRWSGQFLLPHWARSHNCHACACLHAPPSLIPLSLWLNHGQWCLGLIGTICCYQSLQRGSKKAHFHLCPPTTRDLKEEGAGSYCLMLKALPAPEGCHGIRSTWQARKVTE